MMDGKRLFICHNGRGSIIRQRLDFFGAGSKASGVDRNPSSDRRYHVSGCSDSYAAAELKEFLVDRGVVVDWWLLGTWVWDWTKRVARFGIMAICQLLIILRLKLLNFSTMTKFKYTEKQGIISRHPAISKVFAVKRALSVILQIYMAGGGGKEGSSRNLDQTSTWAVSGVCAVIILISIALEKILHKVGTWLTERHKKALYDALEKVKAELMILGFISLILVFSQYYIADICIPINVADTMLPCPAGYQNENKENENKEGNNRRLLSYERRVLAGKKEPSCKEGYVSLISVDGLHQIHILIFFLAVLHVIYSAITMALGRLKIRGWKQWEQETLSHDYEFSNDPSRFRLSHETSFVRAHDSFWTRIPFFFYIGCFFRQFFRSVGKSDYLTLRNGFITVHLAPGSRFNFQKYIKRSLEDDFKIVVGVSPVLWGSFVLFLLLNVSGWRALFWASLIPLIIILAVGTKLQAILTRMALDITDRHAVVQGMPLVQGSDKYFWFGRPQLVLHLIHFALFQNAFQITYFFWIWYEYGIDSCFHDNINLLVVKIALGVFVLCLCSYITLPLYALIAQMGSNMKKSIFDEQTSKALKKWHMAVKKKNRGREGRSPTRTLGDASPISSTGSPLRPTGATLQRFETTGHSTHSYGHEENDGSDIEEPSSHMTATSSLIIRTDRDDIEYETSIRGEKETKNEDEFSFVKPALQK